MNDNRKLIQKGQYIFFFVASLVVLSYINVTNYVCDAANYVQLSQSFWVNDSFSIYNFGEGVRGIWYPLILAPFIRLHRIWGWRILASIWMTFLVCFVPQIICKRAEYKNLFVRRCILFLLLWIFWSGVFAYPLSDVVSLCFMVLGIYFILKNKRRYWIISGIFFYVAYNIRTIYLFPVFVIVIYVIIQRKKMKYKLSSVIACIFLGIIISSIPQMLINYEKYEIVSAKVVTNNIYPNGLFAFQLGEGLTHSQFEGYIGDPSEYPYVPLRFTDPVGISILREEGIASTLHISIKDYIRIIAKYPLDVLGIYGRHIISMLNPVWGELYILDIHKIKIHLTVINYILMCILITWTSGLVKNDSFSWRNTFEKCFGKDGKRWAIVASILTPCLAILPGCVEQRFFFPVYFLMYVILIFVMGKQGMADVIKKWKERPFLYLLVYGIVFVALCSVWGSVYANIGYDCWISLL